LKVEKAEKILYYFLCGFSLSLPLSKALGNIFLSLSVLAFCYRIFYKRDDVLEIVRRYKKIFLITAIMLGAVFVSAISSDVLLLSLRRFFERYIAHVLAMVSIAGIFYSREKIIFLAKLLLVGTILSNLSVVFQALPHLSEESWRFGGVLGIMPQGTLLAMFLPIYFLLLNHFQDKRIKILAAVAILIGVAAILFTGTRGAWLAALVLIPTIILIHSKNKIKHLSALTAVFALIIGLVMITPTLSNRVATITDMQMQSNSERLLMWQSAWQMFKDHPILGIGYGQYIQAYQTQYISPLAKEKTLQHAHNNFMQILAECGLVGFAAFILLLGYFSYFALKGWTAEKNFACLLFLCILWGMMLHGFTEYNFETSVTSKVLWYSLGLCLAFRKKISA